MYLRTHARIINRCIREACSLSFNLHDFRYFPKHHSIYCCQFFFFNFTWCFIRYTICIVFTHKNVLVTRECLHLCHVLTSIRRMVVLVMRAIRCVWWMKSADKWHVTEDFRRILHSPLSFEHRARKKNNVDVWSDRKRGIVYSEGRLFDPRVVIKPGAS